jgi:hypothetical protein
LDSGVPIDIWKIGFVVVFSTFDLLIEFTFNEGIKPTTVAVLFTYNLVFATVLPLSRKDETEHG